MVVRIKDWMIPYTGGIGIEITNNHVINVLLRAMNNLIHVNENRELYVDLQLDDWIQPDDDFPVGVTTWEILQEDWWQQSGTILNWKTTSWDYVRFIYANDEKLYYDPWTWEWIEIMSSSSIWPILDNINTKTFWIDDNQDLEDAQSAYDWLDDDKMPLLSYDDSLFILTKITDNQWSTDIEFRDLDISLENWESTSTSKGRKIVLTVVNDEVTAITIGEYQVSPNVLATDVNYNTPYTPLYNWSPTTKKYVDDGLATKQDILTPWTRITIQDNVISADISGVFIYKWNVPDSSQLPSSWQTVGDCWYDETDHTLWAWDWTQWKDIGWTWIDLSNYFNLNINDSDDITEGSVHLFCTSIEKNYWNNKQDTLIAWDHIHINWNVISADWYTEWYGIDINSNNVVSNTKPFDPENEWILSQWLKKTSTWYRWSNINEFTPSNQWTAWQVIKKTPNGYEWSDETAGSYLAGHWININDRTIVNTLPFEPSNTGTVGQVLKRNSSWYHWADESGWWWGWGWNFEPDNVWSEWQVLTREWWGYRWMNVELPSGENNVKFWTINTNTINTDSALQEEIFDWVSQDANNWAILNDTYTNDVFIYNNLATVWQYQSAVFFGKKRISHKVTQPWQTWWDYTVAYENRLTIATNGSTYNTIVDENPDDSTHTNYISAMTQGIYTKAFRPTEDYQPATKKYVDSVATWSVSLPVITQNSTGTTYTVSQEWVGTQAQYNAITPVNWVIYNIIPSS